MTLISPHTYNPFPEAFVLPAQLETPPASAWPVQIALAVLEDAIDCASKPLPPPGKEGRKRWARIRQEAAEWIASDDDSWQFSFVRVCAALGYEPSYIRRGVSKWGFRLKSGLRLDITQSGRPPQPSMGGEQ